ncbi:MAG TPA: SMP-30/gluconolactonase/LRE family protein [Ktedonobacterales bacterium]|nr:SMP-30/gluconolactonase/LRE family protein [Ktedonobacterales bacterium]
MNPLFPLERAALFFDGTFSEPRLAHPECVAVDAEGHIWCGGEHGEIYRIWRDGSKIELIASTGGFTLGIAFDAHGNLYSCDLKHAAVFRLNTATRQLETFATGSAQRLIRIPNFPVVDAARNCLYVSDSHDQKAPGPGVWRFDVLSGQGALWYAEPMHFANGMALSASGNELYVVETFAHRISKIPIRADGSAGSKEIFLQNLPCLPDGIAFDAEQNLYIACYEPSRLYRVRPDGHMDLLIDDPDAHTLCHPTNCAFRGTTLFTANLGRWHITQVDVGVEGLQLL